MTSIELLMPFLVIALFCGTVAVGVLCARAELRLAARKHISLGNYKQKNYLFYITRDIPVLVVSLALAAAGLALLIVALTHEVIRLYALPLALLLPVCGCVAWLSFSRNRCARDLHLFDAYHVRVQDLLSGKTRLEAEIGVCRRRAEELRGKLRETLGAFNRNLSRGIHEELLRELFAPLDGMLSEYLADIARFSEEIENEFNAALQEFLLNGKEPELHILPLRTFDETVVDDLLTSIKTSFGSRITAIVVDEAVQGAVHSASSLGNIMNLLHGLDVRVEGSVLSRFISVAARFEDRAALARLLYQNRQIPASLARETLIADRVEWMFVEGMSASFGARDQAAILGDLLAGDHRSMCQSFLLGMDETAIPVLDSVLDAAPEESARTATCRLIRAYRLMLEKAYAVGNSANVVENLALMLYDRRMELGLDDAERARVEQIVQSKAFLAASKEIAGLYQGAATRWAPFMASATRILLYFLGSPAGGGALLRADLLASLLCEYRFTLSVGDLGTMRTLLAALTLLSEKDPQVIAAVLAELEQTPAAVQIPSGAQPGDAARVGQLLLSHLTQHDRVRLRSVIYRTETQRQTLDHIVRAS